MKKRKRGTRKRQRGELTVNQIIVIVILIISFAVILLFWWQLRPRGEADKEICRNSVVLKGFVPIFKDAVRLNCKTQKICFTTGECEAEESYDEVRKVSSKEELKKEITELIYDCWWMMGEGKVDYHTSGTFKNVYCAQCFLVDFDNSVKDEIGNVGYLELYDYMKKTNIPGKKENFMTYLYGTDDIQKIRERFKEDMNTDITKYSIDTSGRYSIVTGIIKKGRWMKIGAGIGAAAGVVVSIITGPPGWIVGGIVAGGATAGGGIGYVLSIGDDTFLSPMLVRYDADVLAAMECKDFDTLI